MTNMIKRRVMPSNLEVAYNANPEYEPMLPIITLSFVVQNEDAEDIIDELRASLLKLVDLTIEILEEGEVQNG